MQHDEKLDQSMVREPYRGKAVYRLYKNNNLKFQIRRFTQPDLDERKPNQFQQILKPINIPIDTQLVHMREACELQFKHISDLIGRPFPGENLFSQIDHIKLQGMSSETAAESSAGSQPTNQTPQLHHFEDIDIYLKVPSLQQKILSPLMRDLGQQDMKNTYHEMTGKGLFDQEDDLEQFLISDVQKCAYKDLSDFL